MSFEKTSPFNERQTHGTFSTSGTDSRISSDRSHDPFESDLEATSTIDELDFYTGGKPSANDLDIADLESQDVRSYRQVPVYENYSGRSSMVHDTKLEEVSKRLSTKLDESDIILSNIHKTRTNNTTDKNIINLNRLNEEKFSDPDGLKNIDDIPKMGGNRDFPPLLPNKDDYLVKWDKDDISHPHNFPVAKKILYCFVVGLVTFSTSLGSAMFAAASPEVEVIYHIGPTVGALGTSLYICGFASGPILWGPLSELFGRKCILVISSFGFTCFCFACATAENIQTIMITRFFEGFIGAAPTVIAPAALADLFGIKSRGLAFTSFAVILFGGPMFAPIIGAFIVKNSSLGWRWTQYITGIVAGVSFVLSVCLYQETHHPTLLKHRAETIRRKTGNWGIKAPQEEVQLNFKEIVENNLTRPMVMLVTEPILLLISIYNAFIYGLLYMFLTVVPLIFQGRYQFEPGVAELPYLSMFIGVLLGGLLCSFFDNQFIVAMKRNNGKPIPEARLPPMMIGGFFFAAGLFWLGWAGDYAEDVHWIVPTLGAAPVGFGLITIFLPCITFLVDCYLYYAASALAASTFLRCSFACACPLFARQMFEGMEIKWASTLLGVCAVLLIPVPFLFYRYGRTLREKSRYAFVM